MTEARGATGPRRFAWRASHAAAQGIYTEPNESLAPHRAALQRCDTLAGFYSGATAMAPRFFAYACGSVPICELVSPAYYAVQAPTGKGASSFAAHVHRREHLSPRAPGKQFRRTTAAALEAAPAPSESIALHVRPARP